MSSLEAQLAAELQHTRIPCTCGGPEISYSRALIAVANVVELRVVEGIEGLDAELELHAFRERERLIKRSREIETSGSQD